MVVPLAYGHLLIDYETTTILGLQEPEVELSCGRATIVRRSPPRAHQQGTPTDHTDSSAPISGDRGLA
jgi:hypothetical protein